jgi:hypothetical protein
MNALEMVDRAYVRLANPGALAALLALALPFALASWCRLRDGSVGHQIFEVGLATVGLLRVAAVFDPTFLGQACCGGSMLAVLVPVATMVADALDERLFGGVGVREIEPLSPGV